MSHLKIFLLVLCCSSITIEAIAQDTIDYQGNSKLKFSSDLQVGILAGGQIVNESFNYKPGVIGQFSLNAQISPRVHGGLGVALLSLEDETILPVFIDFKAFFGGENASFLGLNIGASAAWSNYYRNVSEFDYEGGLYFSPYYTFQFPITEEINFLVSTGLVHHIGEIEFFTEFDEEYEERFAMDFLTIRLGIRF